MPSAQLSRLFFALWPPGELVTALSDLAKSISTPGVGRSVPQHNIHLTLSFLGGLDDSKRQCAERVASTIRSVAFRMQLDRIGFWPRPGVLWVGPSEIPQAFLQLVDTLNTSLAECGITLEKRAFKPHLTLIRKMRPGPYLRSIELQTWDVNRFHLVRSETRPEGACYQILRTWSLEPTNIESNLPAGK